MPPLEEKLPISKGNIVLPYANLSLDEVLLQMIAEELSMRRSIRRNLVIVPKWNKVA